MLNINKSNTLPNRSLQSEKKGSTSNLQKSSNLLSDPKSENIVPHNSFRRYGAVPRQSLLASNSRNTPNTSSLRRAPGNHQPAGTLPTRSGRMGQVGDSQAKKSKLKAPLWAWVLVAGLVTIISRQQVLDQLAEENAGPMPPDGEGPQENAEGHYPYYQNVRSDEGKKSKPAALNSSQPRGQKWGQKAGIWCDQKGKNQMS